MNGTFLSTDDEPELENGNLFPNIRQTKKRTNSEIMDQRPSQFSRRIVPKLGPTLSVKLKDEQHLKTASSAIASGVSSNINTALNFLMGWSAIVKDITYEEGILDVICALLELILGSLDKKIESYIDHFENSQYSIMESDLEMQCSGAGLILKNLILCSEKTFMEDILNSKASHLLVLLLNQTERLCYSLTRDLLFLCRKITSYDGNEQNISHGLVTLFINRSLPLRLRVSALDALGEMLQQDQSIEEAVLQELELNALEMRMNLKIALMLPIHEATKEAESEFDGCLDYDDLALLQDATTPIQQKEEELKLWAWKLQSEALVTTTNFLKSIAKLDVFEFIALDEAILLPLVDLTTGKKMTDILNERKKYVESKNLVMVSMKRNIHSSEMHAYKTILDIFQEGSTKVRKRLHKFEKYFVLGAFESTWQAKQCAMILSLMKDS